MSAPFVARLAVQQSRAFAQKRNASTTSEAANAAATGASKAKDVAQESVSQAQQGLSRAANTANSALSSAASAANSTISTVGGQTGAAIKFAQGLVPPTVYYARVVGELGKIIYNGRNMQPPTTQHVQSYLAPVSKAFSNPAAVASGPAQTVSKTADAALNDPQAFLTRLRNFDTAALTSVGIVAAETIGFFSIGEIIGRFKIVGYRSSGVGHAHH